MPFIEDSLGIDVPDSVIQNPIIEKLHTAANDIVCWGNVSGFKTCFQSFLFKNSSLLTCDLAGFVGHH